MCRPCLIERSAPLLSFVLRPLHLIAGLLLLGIVACLPRCAASEEKIAIEQTPPAVRSGAATLTGHYNPNQMLRLVFALKPPHLEDEEQFLRQLQDPTSPLFHKFLSEQEWNQRFAPSVQDEQAVVAWAQSQGLTITQRYANRLVVDVEAPSAVIEKALDVSINTYQIGERSYFSNDRDPSIPAQFGGVVHSLLGLNNIQVVHGFSKNQQKPVFPDYSPGPAYALGTNLRGDGSRPKVELETKSRKDLQIDYNGGPYEPYNLYPSYAYNYEALQSLGHCCNPLNNPNNSPPESSIAIAIWGDFDNDDLNTFLVYNESPVQNVQRYFIDGTPPCCDPEATLDVEWSTAMSNSFDTPANTAEVHMYEGANDRNSTMLNVVNRILNDGHARVLSMSWGGSENYDYSASEMDSFHAVFNQMVGQGWTLVAASGDAGPTVDCLDRFSVSYPASDPDVTAVGGTTLALNQPGSYGLETGWAGSVYGCSNNDGGSGGGCSTYFAAPDYQSNPACGPHSRSVPDLALNADWVNTPQYFYFERMLQPNGGTSVAAPELAGFFAQENAYLLYLQSVVGDTCTWTLSSPCAPLGSANPYIYYEALHGFSPHYPFYDITYGCNGNDITQKYHLTPYCSGWGYDLVTGWGSVNMLQFAWTLNDFLAGDSGAPTLALSGPPVNTWYNSDQTISWTLTDTSGSGHPAIGVAGASLAWDADPGNAYSEPIPGTGNGFYGPQFVGATGSAGGLAGLSQGCHYAFVRGWDNAGESQVASYGPLCFDSIGPLNFVTLSGNYQGQGNYGANYTGPVEVTLSATDAGSGVAYITYVADGSGNRTYAAPFVVYQPGPHYVWSDATDRAGNSGEPAWIDFTITSNSKYSLTVSKAGTGTVTSSDGGINCGSTCSASYWDGQPITLTAAPDPGFAFTGWSGCDISYGYSCQVSLSANQQVYATFNVPVALQFIPVTPCRVADTRWPHGPFGGPSLAGGSSREITIPNSACNIPATASAYSLNVTAIPQGPLGLLTAWPSGYDRPEISIMNSWDGRIKANAAIVPAGTNGAISLYASDTTDVALDIDGYFVPAPDPSALAFYPLAPCRVADTRKPNGPLGGPSLVGAQQRDLPVLSSSCGIPSTALAYSMNFTVLPIDSAPLWVFNAWPAGQGRPGTSTLNAPTGTVVANAAIVPAGNNGDIGVWASSDTDLLVDIDGYFAPAGTGGLSLYSNVPCRVLDTRNTTGAFDGQIVTDVVGSGCGVPATAQAFVLNATVVPDAPVYLLTLWPDGAPRPTASTLNAYDGIVTSNMAIVPTTNGSIDDYTAGLTNLLLDISSYFAP